MKNKILILITIILLLITIKGVIGATAEWVNDPANCPSTDATEFPGQSCSPLEICGESSDIAQCYDTDSLTAPVGSSSTSTQYSGSFGGGYIINCFASADAASPFCDNSGNYWCNRDSSCQNVNRYTECTGGSFDTFSCTTCISGYTYCDGSYVDADGCEIQSGVTQFNHTSGVLEDNAHHKSDCTAECDSGYLDCDGNLGTGGDGCEIQDGGQCTLAGLPGVYDGCSGSAGNCVINKQHFVSGNLTSYSTNSTHPFLWGIDYGKNYLVNLTFNKTKKSFLVTNQSSIISDGNVTASFFIGDGIFLNTNSSNYWDNLDSINSTQLEQQVGQLLGIKDSWLKGLFVTQTQWIANNGTMVSAYTNAILVNNNSVVSAYTADILASNSSLVVAYTNSILANNNSQNAYWLANNNTVTTYINAQGGGGSNTTEEMQDAAWDVLTGTQTLITVTYQDGSNEVDFVVTDMRNSTGDIIDGKDLGLGWKNLTDYPSACTTAQTITTMGDTLTCSSISIAELQVSDLVHTTDTSANTECVGTTTYLDGEGGCDTINPEGSGNGFDADTVDTLHASSFLRSDTADTGTGRIDLQGGLYVESATEGLCIDDDTVCSVSPGAGNVYIYDGALNICNNGCSSATSTDGNILIEGDIAGILGGDLLADNLRFGSSASNGAYEFEDGSVCIGITGCTVPTGDGRLRVEEDIEVQGGSINMTDTTYNQINFGTGGVNTPSNQEGWKLKLYDSGLLESSYGIGIQGSTLWFQTNEDYIFYKDGTLAKLFYDGSATSWKFQGSGISLDNDATAPDVGVGDLFVWDGMMAVCNGDACSNTAAIADGDLYVEDDLEVDGMGALTTDRYTVCVDKTTNLFSRDTAGNNCDTSSRRYKHSINNLTLNAVDVVMKLKPVSFIKNSDITDRVQYGFVAEEVAEAEPNLALWEKTVERIEEDADGNNITITEQVPAKKDEIGARPYSISKYGIMSMNSKAIQEQQLKIINLESEIVLLKDTLCTMNSSLSFCVTTKQVTKQVQQNQYFCFATQEVRTCDFGISGGIGTRCYKTVEHNSWYYCGSGWGLI